MRFIKWLKRELDNENWLIGIPFALIVLTSFLFFILKVVKPIGNQIFSLSNSIFSFLPDTISKIMSVAFSMAIIITVFGFVIYGFVSIMKNLEKDD